MDDPVQDIERVIRLLTQSRPSVQRQTIENYFTPDASFQHPFCRTGSFNGSRFFIYAIFRWYKIMSPKIDLSVNGAALDEKNLVLYVNISQTFRIWFVPFYSAPVNLVTVLHLLRDVDDGKYYLTSQNDLYQVNEFVKFIVPGIGFVFVWLWQMFATLGCLLLANLFWPVSWLEEYGDGVVEEETRKLDNTIREGAAKLQNGGFYSEPAIQQT